MAVGACAHTRPYQSTANACSAPVGDNRPSSTRRMPHTMARMDPVREPAVAGTFYPAEPAHLEATVQGLLDSAEPPLPDVDVRMVIVPHAGYVYSGPVAATIYSLLPPLGVRGVVLVGPSHFVRFPGLALPSVDRFATPLGEVEIDAKLVSLGGRYAAPNAAAHAREHSLEVQLPFLQVAVGEFSLLPVLTGDDDPAPASALLDAVLDSERALVVVSSDLSHYEDYATARRLDKAAADAIVSLRPNALDRAAACGRTGIQAALRVARRRGWLCRLLDLRSSGDTAGDHTRVVGYGAFVLGPISR